MNESKLKVISKIFDNDTIRTIWSSEEEKYYISIIDIIATMTDNDYQKSRNYWKVLKFRLKGEGNETVTDCNQLKLKAEDGKYRATDVCDIEGMFRIIQSIPSKKAESMKQWLAKLGKERIDEVFDPEIATNRVIDYYRKRGYPDEWIKTRMTATLDRKKLTDVWKDGGVKEGIEYAILTNEIYKTWSGMTAKEYKTLKNIRKENLRDNMTDIEVSLANLGEVATRELSKKHKPYGLLANKKIAKAGGDVAKTARTDLEEKLGETIISKDNTLNYEYIEENKQII